jgi:hypothetical protein
MISPAFETELVIRRAQGNAYAWAAFATDHVGYMPSVQSAYLAWQRSNGATVYPNLAPAITSEFLTDAGL